MEPFERFKNSSTNGNIWIYVLSLAEEKPLPKRKAESLIFEKFGFLPSKFTCQRVLGRLEKGKYIESRKYQGEKAYTITKKGRKELQKMKEFCQNLLQKL
jgi:DNA-binding PadR family transcriptional regulator